MIRRLIAEIIIAIIATTAFTFNAAADQLDQMNENTITDNGNASYNNYLSAFDSEKSLGEETSAKVNSTVASNPFDFNLEISASGLYKLGFSYKSLNQSTTDLVFGLKIDGKYAFDEAEKLKLPRMWKLSENIRIDGLGNEFSPEVLASEDLALNYLYDKVKWTVFTNDDPFRTKFIARVATNDSPDIVRLWQPYLSDMQALQPLNKMEFNFNDEAWDKRVMHIYGFNGNVYATNMRNTLLQQPRCMVYNANLIGKYDLEDPYTLWKQGKWTWEKFEQICEAYTKETDDSCYAWTSYKWADIPDSYGSSMLKRQGDTFVSNTNDPNLIKGWQKMASFVEKGYTNHIYFDRTNFENGKVLFFTESPIGTRRTHYYFQSIKSVGGVRIVPIPSTSSNEATVMSEIEAYGIPVGAKNGDLSPYFLRYYLDAENYDESNFFSDKSILDVYKKLMSSDSFYVNYDDCIITEDLGKKGITINSNLTYAKAAQVQATIDQNANIIKAAANSANGLIKKLK